MSHAVPSGVFTWHRRVNDDARGEESVRNEHATDSNDDNIDFVNVKQ